MALVYLGWVGRGADGGSKYFVLSFSDNVTIRCVDVPAILSLPRHHAVCLGCGFAKWTVRVPSHQSSQ